ncbi:uncharacterized protein LOC104582746 isoform X3 [Brachypodium distachyon]|uniref:Uncharacterized protein n=2 Tax=Brachypodium distachyon TaxID=15368 RepID=A0A2K2DC02_BRADI|nr:uncharacterized protein LOC104582746 isoform X3 [Brachypodium distachyon]PNT71792.1 hypothetical protein BRADI_2g35625v3 [Brachypodium distachyon]|eukprot:XP_014754806.1 uncharacterized protein LOC104582746 isoform X3 [Brachypodium distachyon]
MRCDAKEMAASAWPRVRRCMAAGGAHAWAAGRVPPACGRRRGGKIHTAVVLYNYYHRKLSPQLAFADANQFFMCASLPVGEDLLTFLYAVHECENNSGEDVLYATDKAAMEACEIAEALDASKHFPDMSSWPIAKVAVLLLNPTRKKCLIEYSSDTKGVWSIIEKEFDAAASNSQSCNQSAGQESMNKGTFGALDGPYMLQQLAFTEVERRTGMKCSNLRLLDEDLTYSLSTKRTTTKLFVMEYEQTMKSNHVEKPLEELICRKWPSDSALNEQSCQHGNVEEQANSKSKMQKRTTKMSTPKQNRQAIKSIDTNSNNNCSTSKHRKNNKRIYKASRNTTSVNMEDQDDESPLRQKYSLIVVDAETSKLATKSRNTKEIAGGTSGGNIVIQTCVQMDKKKRQKQSICGDIIPDVFSTKAPSFDPVMENSANLEGQNMGVSEKSGGITENKNDQMYDSLQSIQKIRNDLLRKQHILEERSAQCEMDIQTILSEGKMTPSVISIIDKYKKTSSNMAEVANSSCYGDGGQTLTKRMRLREALRLRNKCHELDEICRGSNWILPRYSVIPSVADGMFNACVHLRGLDFDMRINGGRRMTPYEARCSAAANMIIELRKRAEEE